MNTINTTPKTKALLTIEQLRQSPEFLACTAKAQTWIIALVESGSRFDYKAATLAAYDCKSPRQAQIFSHAIRKWPSIRRVLALYLGLSEKDQFLEDLQQTIRHAPEGSIAKVKAMSLFARLKFCVGEDGAPEAAASKTPTAPAPADSQFKVGDRVTNDEDGRDYIVASVSPDGSEVLEAEPVE
jgi:hypothetical protein